MSARPDLIAHPRSAAPLRATPGVWLFAVASFATGLLDFIWGDFEAAHQPVQALSDHIPGRTVLAYLAAVWLMAASVGLLFRRGARFGAAALAAIYCIFMIFWLPRFYTAPHALGFHIPLILSLLAGLDQQLILVAAAGLIYFALDRLAPSRFPVALLVARWACGFSCIDFGLAHLTAVPEVAGMVPKWLPGGGGFWVILTGVAFVLAGISIIAGVLDVLAARLVALMLFLFSVLVLAPAPMADPHNHIAWGSNAYNLAAVGAFWILAEFLNAARSRSRQIPA